MIMLRSKHWRKENNNSLLYYNVFFLNNWRFSVRLEQEQGSSHLYCSKRLISLMLYLNFWNDWSSGKGTERHLDGQEDLLPSDFSPFPVFKQAGTCLSLTHISAAPIPWEVCTARLNCCHLPLCPQKRPQWDQYPTWQPLQTLEVLCMCHHPASPTAFQAVLDPSVN